MYDEIKIYIDKMLDVIFEELKSENLISNKSISWQDVAWRYSIRRCVEQTAADIDDMLNDIADIAAKEAIDDSISLIENAIDDIKDLV